MICKECKIETVFKFHSKKSLDKLLKNNRGYYSLWQYCLRCKKNYLDKQMYNPPKTSQKF